MRWLNYARLFLQGLVATVLCFVAALMILWGMFLGQVEACLLGTLLGAVSSAALIATYKAALHA